MQNVACPHRADVGIGPYGRYGTALVVGTRIARPRTANGRPYMIDRI